MSPDRPVPAHGMTAQELATYSHGFLLGAMARITGVGADQYAEQDGQRFERMPLPELFDWAEEELQDVAVYAAMLHIRLTRLRAVLEERTEVTSGE